MRAGLPCTFLPIVFFDRCVLTNIDHDVKDRSTFLSYYTILYVKCRSRFVGKEKTMELLKALTVIKIDSLTPRNCMRNCMIHMKRTTFLIIINGVTL